jgi:hypothetical protein
MKTINSLLLVAILIITTVMTWTYFAVRSEDSSLFPQVGIGGGPETDSNASLTTLFTERTILTVTHVTNLYDGNDTTNTAHELEINTQNIGENIKKLGTAADKEMVVLIFENTLKEYEAYTKGLKGNNPELTNRAKENLQMQAMDFGNLIHKLLPTISEQKGTTLMDNQNIAMIKVIETHAQGNTLIKANAIEKANTQALQFAEELSEPQQTP